MNRATATRRNDAFVRIDEDTVAIYSQTPAGDWNFCGNDSLEVAIDFYGNQRVVNTIEEL